MMPKTYRASLQPLIASTCLLLVMPKLCRADDCAPSGWDHVVSAWNTLTQLPHWCCQHLGCRPLCPTCKRNYCPLDVLADDYGYRPPNWHVFPGTTASYTPQRRDIGISAEPSPGPDKKGASLPVAPTSTPLALDAAPPRELPVIPKDAPSFPIAPATKADPDKID